MSKTVSMFFSVKFIAELAIVCVCKTMYAPDFVNGILSLCGVQIMRCIPERKDLLFSKICYCRGALVP